MLRTDRQEAMMCVLKLWWEDSNGETWMVLENQPLNGFVEVAEAMTLFEATSKAIKADIHLLWTETDSLIL